MAKRRKVGKGRILDLSHGMSEEDQATFKRNMGPHGGDDVSSIEGDNSPVGVRVVKIRLKRRVFEPFKPRDKCLRAAFFVGSRTRKDGFLPVFNPFFFR